MLVTLKNDFTDEKIEFMSPSTDVVRGTIMVFTPDSEREDTYTLHLAGHETGKLIERNLNGDDCQVPGRWTLVSITDDVAFLWNRNDVAYVYRNNFDNPSLAPSEEDADNIIATLNEKDDLNYAVRMAILEEINYYLGENDENYYLSESEKDNG